MKKTINGQTVYVSSTHVSFNLREPFWSAFQRFGWDEGIEGIGISKDIIEYALEKKKKIIVNYKNKKLEITPKKCMDTAEKYHSYYTTGNTLLYEIPRNVFKNIPQEEEMKVTFNPSKLREAMERNGIKL